MLANALRHIAAPALKALRRTPPSFASTVMAGAVVREIPGSIGGAHTRGKPLGGTMIAISQVAQVLQVLRLIRIACATSLAREQATPTCDASSRALCRARRV